MRSPALRLLAVAVASAAALAGASGGLGGCAAGPEAHAQEPPQPAAAVVEGDWDDVEAAIWTAADQMEIAVERIQLVGGGSGGSGDILTATLRTILGEPVTVTARRVAPEEAPPGPDDRADERGGAPGTRSTSASIQLEAQFGRFAEPDARATRLLELIERRLRQLHGVGAAPIR